MYRDATRLAQGGDDARVTRLANIGVIAGDRRPDAATGIPAWPSGGRASRESPACLFILSTLRGRPIGPSPAYLPCSDSHCRWVALRRLGSRGNVRTVSPLWPDGSRDVHPPIGDRDGAVLVLFNWHECDDRRAADYHACLLTATAGFSLVGSANDLIVLFLALELISIPTYVMLYLPGSNDPRAQEAAVKYFMLSVLSSAFTLSASATCMAQRGRRTFRRSRRYCRDSRSESQLPVLIASVLILAGLGFRVTAFPFHFYAPDVYQGGPTGTVAFLAFVPKLAGFAALLKLFAYVGAHLTQ